MKPLPLCCLALMLFQTSCNRNRLNVRQVPQPDYPMAARFERLQDTVVVDVRIGTDGTVLSANGRGIQPLLVRAAEENAKRWSFGPFPAVSEFPIEHTITYKYVLAGEPKTVSVLPAVKTFLPDRIEITAVPLASDYPPMTH